MTVETNTVTDSVSGIDIGFWNCRSGICTGNIITNCMADNIKSDEENVTIKDNSAMNPLNGWISINEYWYYFSSSGVMQTAGIRRIITGIISAHPEKCKLDGRQSEISDIISKMMES